MLEHEGWEMVLNDSRKRLGIGFSVGMACGSAFGVLVGLGAGSLQLWIPIGIGAGGALGVAIAGMLGASKVKEPRA